MFHNCYITVLDICPPPPPHRNLEGSNSENLKVTLIEHKKVAGGHDDHFAGLRDLI